MLVVIADPRGRSWLARPLYAARERTRAFGGLLDEEAELREGSLYAGDT
jgi:hypothetical protein